MIERFCFADVFAGIGGFRIPFEEIGGKCVFTAEWNRFSGETYRANFNNDIPHKSVGDIKPYSAAPGRIPHHDILLAGFPCPPFSTAGVPSRKALGRSHGFDCDTQGTLFFDLARIIKHHRPTAFLLENVRGLKWHNGGETYRTIKAILTQDLGYELHTRVISAKSWVPQRRERVFLVGFRNPSGFSFDDMVIPKEGPVLRDILNKTVPERYTLRERTWRYLQKHKERHRKAGNGFGYSLFGPNDVARTLTARYYNDGAEILIRQEGKRPRKLTPRECSRIMGFDRPGGAEFHIPVSDSQAYRQFGNAVVVPVVRAIARTMSPHIVT